MKNENDGEKIKRISFTKAWKEGNFGSKK